MLQKHVQKEKKNNFVNYAGLGVSFPSLGLWLYLWERTRVTSRRLFLPHEVSMYTHMGICMKVTQRPVSSRVHYNQSLWQRKKKRITVAYTAGGLSRGHPWNAQSQTHKCIKKKHSVSYCCRPVLLWWCEGGVAAWGAPLESGTDGQKETTHWSWLTTFLLVFYAYFFPSNQITAILVMTRFHLHGLTWEYVCVYPASSQAYKCRHAYARVCLCSAFIQLFLNFI